MKYNYLDFTTRIWEFNENIALGLSTISVYFYLLKIGSDRGYTKFTVSDSQMSRELKMTRKTVKVCKEKLSYYGIISYQTRNGVPSDFQLNPDYPLIFNETQHSGEIEVTNDNEKIEVLPKETNSTEEIQPEKKAKQTSFDHETINRIPTVKEFIEYAQSIDSYHDQLISEVKIKYEIWINNGWKNNFDRPITNWKSALKNTIPYLKNNVEKNKILLQNIPNITRVNMDHEET